MSQQEFHSGKLRKISDNALQYAEENVKENISNWYKNKLDYLLDDGKYIEVGNKLYEIFDHFESDDYDFFRVDKNEDGTFNFIGSFYNGGTYLSECLEDELKNIKEC